jgi:folate-dependent phosphoribosylglycinamide formyltransferase PurN
VKPRLGVLVSGGGTTLQNFLDLSSDPSAGACDRARKAGKPLAVVEWRKGAGTEFSGAVTAALLREKVDLVLMAGFLRLYRFPPEFAGRVLNIHPALLPAFGGKGMWGHHVHEAVVRAGVKTTGCTVHFADLDYDRGPIVLQRTCPVFFEDSPEDVAARVFELEKQAYPEAVRLFAEGRLAVEDGRVRIS